MKRLILLLFILFFSGIAGHAQVKAFVERKTKNFFLVGNIKSDYRIFGYSSANVTSKKLILFSVFTKDVEGNPNKCPLGSYYETSGLKERDKIMFVAIIGGFVKLKYITSSNKITHFYIKRKFIEFE